MSIQTVPRSIAPTDDGEGASETRPSGAGPAFRRWMLERGVLFLLLLSPVGALFLGLARLVPTRVGYLCILLTFLATPAWVAWRRSTSTDTSEPAFHLHRYALYALFPYVVFSVVRIPMFYEWGMVYWGPWQTFGVGSTGNPAGFWPSLLAGAACYSLQGFALSMGFYTLFKRHNILNALLYYFVFISSLYAFVFPVLLLCGSKPGFPFQFTNYWAHFWMGLTAVVVPALFTKVWPALRRRGRPLVVAGLAAVWATPYAFAFVQASHWQFPTQARLEREAFEAVTLHAEPRADMAMAATGVRYTVHLILGPREYVTYSHAHKAVGAEKISVAGQLLHEGTPVAVCSATTKSLPGLAKVRDPEKYFPALERINHSPIAVTCEGPAAAASDVPAGTPLTFAYEARLTLAGERTTKAHELSAAEVVMPQSIGG
jgi:hypothetical protein